MYVPKVNQMVDQDEVLAFLRENPFAVVVSCVGEQPIATHVPLELEVREQQWVLTGHMAQANPQWKTFQTSPTVLAIFQGSHTYISSSWYGHVNVPTWNYVAVHVTGRVRLLDEERLRETLAAMVNRYESHRPAGTTWDTLPLEYLDKQLKAIVGFEILVESVQASKKMSQNRNDQDFQSIVSHLDESHEPGDRAVSDIMKRVRPHLFVDDTP
ncbi:FMN-binding negative transcriptional regulator [Alicyclobacillus pomorum]|jgi:transcriptional regulator|uniref:FMN-binding negative transcriptional regulator n=1 Tax=Alicyclobacillus pomorum TaxID=204470 RepID=UPI0004086BBE|nr:FMN-binding negative transcriptional regulator [Alicyclobacillus pomorum]